MEINFEWFKNEIIPLMMDFYKLEYSSFNNGDFGNLERVAFEGKGKGGNVDFWSSGWLNLHVVDYVKGDELINLLIEPHDAQEKYDAFKKLKELL